MAALQAYNGPAQPEAGAAPDTTAPEDTPLHVAIIMDGNGRWAAARGLPRLDGHHAGAENIRAVARCFAEHGVTHLTLYAFSTENWTRPRAEVDGLFALLAQVIKEQTAELHDAGVRLRHLGRLDRLPRALQRAIAEATERTRDNTAFNLSVAFDYGGRDEILQAVRSLIAAGVAPEQVDESALTSRLFTQGVPDPDLIIRTAGEMRLSNFLLWQAAYAEYYVTEACWPDFGTEEALRALDAYRSRRRSFGGVLPDGAA